MQTIIPLKGHTPNIHATVFVAPNACVIGEVEIGEESSIWFGTVVRGDVHYIKIGRYTNIQDNVSVHCSHGTNPTNIGDYVTIGHNAVIHGCTIEDNVLIGMGAVILDGAVIKKNAIVAAGAVVLQGTIVEENTIYAGAPAKKVKETGEKVSEAIHANATNYQMYKEWYRELK